MSATTVTARNRRSPMQHEDNNTTVMSTARTQDRSPRSVSGPRPIQGAIGFIGLGRMGTVMAANLAASGCKVIAYIRRPDRAEELGALGLQPTLHIGDLFDCEVVISMLPDDAAAHDVVFGRDGRLGLDSLAAGLMPGAVHLSMSTISTDAATRLAREHGRSNQHYVAAPVFGNPDAASARELFVIAAGDPDQVDRVRPILGLLGQRTFYVGADPAHANLVKLAG